MICRAEDIWQNIGEVLLMPSRGTQRSDCSRESRSKGMPGPSVPIKSHDLVGQGICFEAILLPFPLTEVFSSVTSWSTRITENRRGVDRHSVTKLSCGQARGRWLFLSQIQGEYETSVPPGAARRCSDLRHFNRAGSHANPRAWHGGSSPSVLDSDRRARGTPQEQSRTHPARSTPSPPSPPHPLDRKSVV